MQIRVEVTQEDIDLGCRGAARGEDGGCMVHRAFMRATEGAWPAGDVGVGYYNIALFNDDDPAKEVVLPYPSEMKDFIQHQIAKFDRGGEVSPFAFTIDMPTGLDS